MHIDNLLFILLVLIAMLFRWLASAASKANKSAQEQRERSSTPTPPPLPRAPAESDTDRIRRFLEALGQPAGSEPPRRAVPRTDVAPRPVAPIAPAGEMIAGWPRKRRGAEPKRIFLPGTGPVVVTTEQPPARSIPTPAFEVQQTTAAPESPPPAPTATQLYAAATKPVGTQVERKIDIATLIASGSSLREAIILREVLGPPRSLQPVDAIGSA